MLVRLAWHSAGSYAKSGSTGGSNGGTIRYAPEINHGGNAGLKHAIGVLAPIKENNPGCTWADLIIYAGVVAIEAMGGPVPQPQPCTAASALSAMAAMAHASHSALAMLHTAHALPPCTEARLLTAARALQRLQVHRELRGACAGGGARRRAARAAHVAWSA